MLVCKSNGDECCSYIEMPDGSKKDLSTYGDLIKLLKDIIPEGIHSDTSDALKPYSNLKDMLAVVFGERQLEGNAQAMEEVKRKFAIIADKENEKNGLKRRGEDLSNQGKKNVGQSYND